MFKVLGILCGKQHRMPALSSLHTKVYVCWRGGAEEPRQLQVWVSKTKKINRGIYMTECLVAD